MKALLGVTAGAIGSFIGTPAEVALIRMTADGRYSVVLPDHVTGRPTVY
jgi:solute carrier family 25 (mitochondrial oxoglutarate transporter), member 11